MRFLTFIFGCLRANNNQTARGRATLLKPSPRQMLLFYDFVLGFVFHSIEFKSLFLNVWKEIKANIETALETHLL